MRESVHATPWLMVEQILRNYKYPPDQQEEAIQTVLQQAEKLSAEWACDLPVSTTCASSNTMRMRASVVLIDKQHWRKEDYEQNRIAA